MATTGRASEDNVATAFKLPELGENIETGDLVRLMVEPGATVTEGQPVMELETDKAVIEVPSSVTGTVQDVQVSPGQKVKVGQVIFTVHEGGAAKAPAAPAEHARPASTESAAAEPGTARAAMQTAIRSEGKTEEQALPQDHPAQAPAPAAPSAVSAEFKLPELGENIEQGDLVRLMIAPGDTVSEGQPIMELETDKAVVEVPSSIDGKVKEVRVKQGEKVKVGQVIFTAEAASGSAAPEVAAPRPVAPPQAEPPQKVGAPPLPDVDRRGSTEPASVPLQEEEDISGQQAAKMAFQAAIRAEGKTERAALPPDKPVPAPPTFEMPAQLVKTAGPEHGQPIPAAPHVRRLARELGVDIYQVKGTGPGRRISEDDVKAFTKATLASMTAAAAAPARLAEPELPDFAKWGKVEHVSMRGIRRKTAEHLAQAWTTIPHVTQHDKADITELEQLRARFSAKAEQAGGKMTVTAIALKVCASALKVFPQFNASIDMAKEEVIYKQYTNIGVAVDTDRGLLVPVIRDVDSKNIIELAAELAQLSKKAREKKLTQEEMEGGSFTITNLGGIGGTSFTPIVNHPEVAILGMSRSRTEPVWMNGKFEPRLMLPLSLSYDHRLIDGADAARFLRWVAEAIEQPFLLTVEG
jgi:pyruvate dehydrogenase E2 component (dihydrolipoamide acetyltransferase)